MQFGVILDIFADNLLPIFMAAGAGFALGKISHPDIKTASRLSFHIFSPCLVFVSLAHIGITKGEFEKLALFSFSVAAITAGLAFICGRLLNLKRALLASLVVASAFSNNGNYGLAAVKFAFGEEALVRALVCFVFSTIWTFTAGILIASTGKCSLAQAFKKLFEVPAFYGLIGAGVIRYTNWQIPLFVDRAVMLLSEAAIPLMLVILGLQIAEARRLPRDRALLISVASLLQLVIAPIIALLLSRWIGLSGPARQAAVLQTAMPTAVITTILALEYDLDAELVTGTVLLTTLLSPLTLTPLIAHLLSAS